MAIDGEIDPVAGENHRICPDASALHRLQNLKPVDVGHLDVEESDVD